MRRSLYHLAKWRRMDHTTQRQFQAAAHGRQEGRNEMTNCSMTWAAEIRALASDFMIDKRAVEKIIRTVQAAGYDGDRAYTAAWQRLFDLM